MSDFYENYKPKYIKKNIIIIIRRTRFFQKQSTKNKQKKYHVTQVYPKKQIIFCSVLPKRPSTMGQHFFLNYQMTPLRVFKTSSILTDFTFQYDTRQVR